MATPLVPTYRLEFSLTVDGLLHKMRHYVNVDTSTPVKILGRNGISVITPTEAATGWATVVQTAWKSAAVPAFNWIFQHLVTGVWLPVDSGTVTNTNSSGTSPQQGSQVTLVLRDIAFKKVRVIALETLIPGPFHFTNIVAAAAFNGPLGDLIKGYDTTAATTNPPHDWVVGRSGNYLVTNPLVGATWDLNDKVRRARNLT